MTPALRWAAMRAVLMFNCEGQSYETVHKPQPLWGERRAKAELSRGPSAFQPNTWLLGQTGSLLTVLMYCMDVSMYVICIGCRRLVVHTQKEWMIPGSWNLCFCAGNQESDCCSGCCQSKGRAHYTYTKYSLTDSFMNALYTCMEVRIRLLQWLLSK